MEEQLKDLPFEVVLEEINSRVPIESQMRFRTVCKAFYKRMSDMDYIYKHLDLSGQRFLRLDHNMVRVIDPMFDSDEVNPTMPRCLDHGNTISSVIHCDGLLLCRNQQICTLTLWNPYQKKFCQIEPNDFFSASDRYGMGYCPDARSNYKVLRIFDSGFCPEDGKDKDLVEIYETKAGLWRRVLDDRPLDWKVEGFLPGLSVKGNMYWIASPKAELGSGTEHFIQCFDFSKETFSPICALPIGLDYVLSDTNSLSVYKGDALSLLHQASASTDITVWVTNPLAGEIVSWTHHFTVTNPDLPPLRVVYEVAYPVHFINERDVLVVLCRECDGDKADEENDDDEGTTHIRMYKFGRDGIQHRTDVGPGIFFEHVMCAYCYTPSRVTVH